MSTDSGDLDKFLKSLEGGKKTTPKKTSKTKTSKSKGRLLKQRNQRAQRVKI